MKTGEPLAVGHLLDGRYRIHQLLGVGGMGRVYLANDTRLANRPVAIKEMILGDGVQERKAIEDFHREASVLARLSHPSIPQIIDYFGEQHRHYLVMEYVAGGDLQHRLDEMSPGGRMGEATVLGMARQLLDVLQFLHNQKPPIVYRDLKPANIMIDHHGRAMLVDFGIARFLPPGGRGTQIGSVGYAPPEQYLGKLEPRSDLYALAATMHHLLTGRDPQLQPPFSFPPVNELAPEVSAQTAAVIAASLDKEIAQRPASALSMRDSLPKLPEQLRESSNAAGGGYKAERANVASATVVLARQIVSPRSPTPRSLVPAASAVASPRPLPSASRQVSGLITQPSKVHSLNPRSTPFPGGETNPGLIIAESRDSSYVLSTSKTADLGLRRAGSRLPASGNASGEPGKGRSRIVDALASVRAAVAAVAPPASSANRTSIGEQPASAPSRQARIQPSPGPAPNAPDNGSHGYSPPSAQVAGARLIAVAEGVQFGMLGTRLVVGRNRARGDQVDIDLSNLRRGAERISHRHAEIIKQGSDYFVRDLGSVNGTYIAGRGRLGRDQLYKLKDRDQLVLGGAKLEFRRS